MLLYTYMEWSQKRRIIYTLVFVAIILFLAAYPAYKILHKTPTCFDTLQNGTETGVDCGGVCTLMCSAEVKAPHTVWARAFPLNNGKTYDVAAYIENMNTTAGIMNANYIIRVLGKDKIVLIESKGVTELAPASRVLLFETGVVVSEVPESVEVVFAQDDISKWVRAKVAPSPVVTKNQTLINVDTKPRFDAVLVNTDPVNEVTNLSLSAIIYDAYRNPVAVSKTFVDSISKGSEQNIFFTWPSRFANTPRNFITEILVTPRAIFSE